MTRVWWLFLLASACFDNNKKAGESCHAPFECGDGTCFVGTCTAGAAGDWCTSDGDCNDTRRLSCFEYSCRPHGTANARCAHRTDCESPLECDDGHCRSAAAKEARLLAASGVDGGAPVERAIAPPGEGSRIRTVTTTGRGTAFAACRPDERLVGGGCRPENKALAESYPSGNSHEDTVGARWNCANAEAEYDVTAYALCAKLP